MEIYDPLKTIKTKYIFFTGKGGVGKTSIACATAVAFADFGKKVLLISTDPASNLQDVFKTELDSKGVAIKEVPNLVVANLDPIKSAEEYRNSVISPYKGKLPESVIKNMEEQLSGSCTVEIASFNEFSNFITNTEIENKYDLIIFDTAPTGHTLRLLQLPSAWSNFISESTHGASCLGQLSGLESRKQVYKKAVETLANKDLTTLVLVTRPDAYPLKEANRASVELKDIGIKNQRLVINGLLNEYDDEISQNLYSKQRKAIENLPKELAKFPCDYIPLRTYNIMGIEKIRSLLKDDDYESRGQKLTNDNLKRLNDVIDDIYKSGKKVVFTMGKGGVGKTTVAAAIALGLARKGSHVHLTTTDPAAHLKNVISEQENISMSHIDEKQVLEKYKETVLSKAKENNLKKADLDYIEEDLRSPCTQEIAVFREFAEIVEKAENEIVVIDTAPTGHTLLLLDSTQSYNKEVKRTMGDAPRALKDLLPRLRDKTQTEVIIVTLAEATPVFEAQRLEKDLMRADIFSKWWVINSSLFATKTTNKTLKAKAMNEIEWINKVEKHSKGYLAVIKWHTEELKDEKLLDL